MGLREDSKARQLTLDVAGERVKAADALNLIIKELDANSKAIGLSWEHIDHITAYSKGRAFKGHIIAGVLQGRQALDDILLGNLLAPTDMEHHLEVSFWLT